MLAITDRIQGRDLLNLSSFLYLSLDTEIAERFYDIRNVIVGPVYVMTNQVKDTMERDIHESSST